MLMKDLKEPRGTHDLIGDEKELQNFIMDTAKATSKNYGFEEIQTPIFESVDVFKRTLGEASDIVTKEMYTFEDKKGEVFVLRPEGTAGVARSFISHKMGRVLPLKFYYAGPMFRYERPQKGRQRQFHQVGIEFLGMESPTADIECISMAFNFLEQLKLKGKLTLLINTIGDQESRDNYRTALVNYLTPLKDKLSEDSQTRLEQNPLRILDSKSTEDQSLLEAAPKITDHLNAESKQFFKAVTDGLTQLSIPFEINDQLVRGLDYYNHCVFEVVSGDLGAQSTVLAGGRYNKLIEIMGGKSTPGVGWAAGVERLCLLTGHQLQAPKPIALIGTSPETDLELNKIAHTLRQKGLFCEIIYSGNMSKRLKKAEKKQAHTCIILSDDDLKNKKLVLKNMDSQEQKTIDFNQLLDHF